MHLTRPPRWVAPDVIGIDVGISLLMAENFRSRFCTRTFMRNPEIKRAMTLAGFKEEHFNNSNFRPCAARTGHKTANAMAISHSAGASYTQKLSLA